MREKEYQLSNDYRTVNVSSNTSLEEVIEKLMDLRKQGVKAKAIYKGIILDNVTCKVIFDYLKFIELHYIKVAKTPNISHKFVKERESLKLEEEIDLNISFSLISKILEVDLFNRKELVRIISQLVSCKSVTTDQLNLIVKEIRKYGYKGYLEIRRKYSSLTSEEIMSDEKLSVDCFIGHVIDDVEKTGKLGGDLIIHAQVINKKFYDDKRKDFSEELIISNDNHKEKKINNILK